MNFTIESRLGQKQYAVNRCDVLQATDEAGAFPAFVYDSNGKPAAVAYKQGASRRTMVLGFPFESIVDAAIRRELMASCLSFLLL